MMGQNRAVSSQWQKECHFSQYTPVGNFADRLKFEKVKVGFL